MANAVTARLNTSRDDTGVVPGDRLVDVGFDGMPAAAPTTFGVLIESTRGGLAKPVQRGGARD